MKFISRHANLKVVLRSTIKYVSNSHSGSEEIVKYPPIIVEFKGGIFDTVNWRIYSNDDVPEKFNIIKNEQSLIDHLKENPFYGSDFNEMKVESKSDKIARLRAELSELGADDDTVLAGSPDSALGEGVRSKVDKSPKTRQKPGPKPKNKPKTDNKDSVVDL